MDINSYVTGFVDGEGCFLISFSLRSKMKSGIEVRPSFSVSQHKRSKNIIIFLHQFFQCGSVRFSKRDQNYKFEVRSINDLIKTIIPHFKQYPLKTSKAKDFDNFDQVCQIINSKHHLNPNGLRQIIKLSQNINQFGNKKLNRQRLLKLVNKMKV